MIKKREVVREKTQLEGFKLNEATGIYHCNEDGCTKTYLYTPPAVKHYRFHQAQKDDPIETSKTNTKTKTRTRTKTLQGHEIQNPQDPTKGDLLRAMVEELKVGRINIPDLVMRLNSAALAMDILHRELEQSRAGGLLAKAEAWDKLVEMLPSIPGLYEMLLEAAKGKEG